MARRRVVLSVVLVPMLAYGAAFLYFARALAQQPIDDERQRRGRRLMRNFPLSRIAFWYRYIWR